MADKPITTFQELKAFVTSQEAKRALLNFMPQFAPHASAEAIDRAMTPGTIGYAFMVSLCGVIAEHIAERKSRSETETAQMLWMIAKQAGGEVTIPTSAVEDFDPLMWKLDVCRSLETGDILIQATAPKQNG